MECFAIGTAALKCSAFPATMSAAAAFISTMSRLADFSPCKILDRCSLKAELFWSDFVRVNRPLAYFRNSRRTSDCDFVQSIQPMHHECSMRSQHAQCFRKLFDQFERVNSNHLCGSSGRIC